jgi:hypothetical protein
MQGGWQPPSPVYGPPPGTAPPGAGRGAPPAAPGAYGSYEFNEIENSIIDKTAARARLWGFVSILVGLAQLLSSCGAVKNRVLVANLPLGIVAVIVGITFIGVGNSLRSVVKTRGNDLMHMMLALQKMGTAFMIQILCGIVGVVLATLTWAIIALFFVSART